MIEKLLGITSAAAEAATAAANTAAAAGATADPNAAVQEVNPVISLLFTFAPLVLIFVIFYFMMIRPQRKKDKQVKEMLNNLKAGDRVCTIGGIYGTITGIKDDTVTLTVGRDNLTMVVARWGIRSVEEVTIENDAQELN